MEKAGGQTSFSLHTWWTRGDKENSRPAAIPDRRQGWHQTVSSSVWVIHIPSWSHFYHTAWSTAHSGRAAIAERKGQERSPHEVLRNGVLLPRMLFRSPLHPSPWEQKPVLHVNGFNYCTEIWADRKVTGGDDAATVYWAALELIWSFQTSD